MGTHDESLQELEATAAQYDSTIIEGWRGLYHEKRKRLFQALMQHAHGSSALEMGVADGEMSSYIYAHFDRLTILDGSKTHLEQTHARLAELGYHDVVKANALFEQYEPDERFDAIFMTHILEHLDDPVGVLRRAASWLAPNGRILCAVPNNNSLHRHVGVKMGLIERIDSLNEQDKILGHRRVYGPELLREHMEQAGLRVIHFGGLMVKPLSNRQMESWPTELKEAFFAISSDFPELCSEIYTVAKQTP